MQRGVRHGVHAGCFLIGRGRRAAKLVRAAGGDTASNCLAGLVSLAPCFLAGRPSGQPALAQEACVAEEAEADLKNIHIEDALKPTCELPVGSVNASPEATKQLFEQRLQGQSEGNEATNQLSHNRLSEKATKDLPDAPAPEQAKKLQAAHRQLMRDLGSLVNTLQAFFNRAAAASSATIAVHIPPGFPRPTPRSILRFGLQHPPDALGWFPLTDGSVLGLLQLKPKEASATQTICAVDDDTMSLLSGQSAGTVRGQAQALCVVRLRVVGLLAEHLDDGRHLLELWRVSLRECHEVLSHMIPGLRAWPVHDEQVWGQVLLDVASNRFNSFWSFFRLDRGRRFLDVVRLHFGEEIAFLFTYQAHVLWSLFCLALATVPFMLFQGEGLWESVVGSYGMLTHTMLTVFFGVLVTELWPLWADNKVHRWHAQSECLSRWHMLVLGMLESKIKRNNNSRKSLPDPTVSPSEAAPKADEEGPGRPRRPSSFERILSSHRVTALAQTVSRNKLRRGSTSGAAGPSRAAGTVEEQAQVACEDVLQRLHAGRGGWKVWVSSQRFQRALLLVPILLTEWAVIFLFFNFCVWFEIWVHFDWGGCNAYNEHVGEWECISADQLHGLLGVLMGALPAIFEGAFFELLLCLSKTIAEWLISLFDFPTTEGRDFALVTVIFFLEVVGKIGFVLMLALGFVPVWDENYKDGCAPFWDYSILGKKSLACLKGEVPYKVRLNVFRSCMKGPMLVSGLVGIGIKTLLPLMLEAIVRCTSRKGAGSCCLRRRLGRCCLVQLDSLLRILVWIFQADHDHVGSCRLLCHWAPTVVGVEPGPACGGCKCCSAHSAGEQPQADKTQDRLWTALFEGYRREFDPFNEYIEVLLDFLWMACFAIVWPLGVAFTLMNQILEHRFDCVKLLSVRRRRFPSTRHMSVAWVPRFAQAACHVGIFVNAALLVLPYRMGNHLSFSSEGSETVEPMKPILSETEFPRTVIIFGLLWVFLLCLRVAGIFCVRRLIKHFRGHRSRSGLHKNREAEAVRCEQGPLSDVLGDLCK